jgi:predicted CXXCH cytochrome family protein
MAYPPPQNPDFFRPTVLLGDISFFDRNGNGIADFDEIQLFGTGGKVECASCHREHGDAPPPPQPNMYLRVTAAMLCMVCHRI